MKVNIEQIHNLIQGPKSAILAGLLMFTLSVLLMHTSLYQNFELSLYDFRFLIKPAPETIKDLVLIDIDDASIASVGEYPWPRYYYADMLDTMYSRGLERCVFDIQFIDYSPLLVDQTLFQEVEKKLLSGNRLTRNDIESMTIDSDLILSSAISDYNRIIVPFSFTREVIHYRKLDEKQSTIREDAIQKFINHASIPVPENREDLQALADPDRVDIQYPIAPIINSTNLYGYVDSDFDIDGTARQIRLIRVFKNRIYFHLALRTVMEMCEVKPEDIEINPGHSIVLHNAFNPANGKTGDLEIPVDSECRMLINWAGTYLDSFEHLPAYSLLEYNKLANSVNVQLALKDMTTDNTERGALAEKIDLLKQQIAMAPTADEKYRLKIEYNNIYHKYDNIINSYLKAEEKNFHERITAASNEEDIITAENEFRDFYTSITLVNGIDKLFSSTIFMGLTASATQDIGITPLDNNYLMVGTYPNVVNTILTESYIDRAGLLTNLILMFFFAISIPLYINKKPARRSLIIIGSSFFIINATYILLFSVCGLWLDQLGANLSLLLPSLSIIIIKFTGEERQKKFIRNAFTKYLSEGVIEQIIEHPDSLKLGGESREITIFFSDIAGFTSISEKLMPQQLVQLLNEYLSEMSDIIMNHHGTVDKYEGDAIMAFWGAPLLFSDHARLACLSTIKMQRRLKEMRSTWIKEGRNQLFVRMGINTGMAVAGNMGSYSRMNYTVMGDAVNLASRLEGANKFYGTYSMVSEHTMRMATDFFEFRELDIIRVVGKSEPIKVFELLEEKGNLDAIKLEVLDHYHNGLILFRNREWPKARSEFIKGLKVDPEDGPSKTYVDRCHEFMKNPPTLKWDGVYTLKSK